VQEIAIAGVSFVVSEKLDLGGLHEDSRMTGDWLRELSLAKARKFSHTAKPVAPRRLA